MGGSGGDVMGMIKGMLDIGWKIADVSAKLVHKEIQEDVPEDIPEDVSADTSGASEEPQADTYEDCFEIEEDIAVESAEPLNEAEEQFDFNGVDCYNDAARMDASLESFQDDQWAALELDEKKQSMTNLADYVLDVTGNENPPEIVFRDDMGDGEYGGYDPATNTLEINENMLDDNSEAADTVAHELWHAYQQQCAENPSSERGREYQEGFDNYISPEYDYEGYQNQMVEAEARAFAQNFKDRLDSLKGGNQ